MTLALMRASPFSAEAGMVRYWVMLSAVLDRSALCCVSCIEVEVEGEVECETGVGKTY